MPQYILPRTAPVIGAAGGSPAEGGVPGLDADRVKKAFLKTIAKGEAPSYDYIIGGKRLTDFSKHPRTRGSAGKYGSSDAAGLYQFLGSTWDEQARKYGYKDFQPPTQDTAAWNYARDVYKQKTGRDLQADLMTGNPDIINEISKVLGKTWTSLPGGSQPNSNWQGQNFADVYNQNLGAGDASGAAPVASGDVAADSSVSASASVDATGSDTEKKDEDKTKKKTDYAEAAGDALKKLGTTMGSEGAVAKNAARASGPTTIPMITPTPQGPVPMSDPRLIEAQRQQLALAMQRLNSGKLY